MFVHPLFYVLSLLCGGFMMLCAIIVFLIGLRHRKSWYGKVLLGLIGAGATFLLLTIIWGLLNQKMVLEPDDFYGNYTVNRSYFEKKQANWQYNHYRFEIKENDSIYFYHTDGSKILETWKGKVYYPGFHKSARLHIKMKEPKHHILESDPTIYREAWKFHLVFNSAKFGNMYFIKNEWEPIDKNEID
ncbi:MAG: hypothetical protein WBG46_13210 [Nonlabens sp.]